MMSTPSLVSQLRDGTVQRTTYLPPDLEEQAEENEWVKITALVVLMISALVAGCAGLTLAGTFPAEIFGGINGVLYTLLGAATVGVGAGILFFHKWKKENDPVKLISLALLILSGLVAGCAALTLMGTFPSTLFGGTEGAAFTLFGTGLAAVSCGAVFYYKWNFPSTT